MNTKPVSQIRVIHSEWIKASTLRSTWFTLAFAILGMVGIAVGIAWATRAFWNDMDAESQANFDAIAVGLGGVILAQLVIAVLGVQIITGEYTTGMIRASLSAVPRRIMLLLGKVTVSAFLSLVVSIIASFAAFYVAQMILGDEGVSLGEPTALRAVLGTAFNLTAIGIMATAVGFIARSTAGGIGIILGILLVLPVIGSMLPFDWVNDLMEYLPSNAGAAVMATSATPADISPLTGFLCLCAWMLVFIVGAGITLVRRDV